MDIKNVKFSVILPVLERQDIVLGFPKALESIYQNTIKPDQVVVTIDGQVSKHFEEILKNYELKNKLDLVWIPSKVGLDKALNLGILKCRNEIIFRADGDDINKTNRFEVQLPYLLDIYDIVGSYIDEYDEDGKYISTRKVPQTDKDILKMMPFRNPINHMTVGFKKSQITKLGGYPELFLKGDYGLWIKLKAANFKFFNIDKSLVIATTGKRMIKDRGGWKYILSEFFLQKFLLKNGLTNIFLAIFIFFTRSIVFALPEYMRSLIYLKFLRSRSNDSNN